MNSSPAIPKGIHASPFAHACMALSGEEGGAASAVYDFLREVRLDTYLERDAALSRLDHWRTEISAVYKGVCTDPLVRALLPAVKKHRCSQEHFARYLDGAEMDINLRRYRTFADLQEYCDCAAGGPANLVIEILGLHDDVNAREYARCLGLGCGLVRVTMDIGTDAVKGRIYVPSDDLDMFSYTVDELRAGTVTEGYLKLGRLMTTRARSAFDRAEKSLRAGLRRRLTALEIVRATCEEYLRKSETRLDDCLLCSPPKISKWESMLIALTTWAQIKIAVFG